MNTAWISETKAPLAAPSPAAVTPTWALLALLPLAYPLGVYRCWKRSEAGWVFKGLYTVLGLPVFLLCFGLTTMLLLTALLPPLDKSVGNRPDRTVRSNAGNYESTFLKTSRETGGAYELIQVEVEPGGGNGWHYHKSFEETFTVLKGELSVGLNDQVIVLKAGQSATAPRNALHYFANKSREMTLVRVKVTPAAGLEKSIRIAYGLGNTGQWVNGEPLPKNPWHLALLMGYSETYLPGIPGFLQEPLVAGLSRLAQWRGEDKALEVFFK